MVQMGACRGKHEPIRMCVFCRRRFPKKAMTRFVLKGNSIVPDHGQCLSGRGAYCCSDEKCMKRLSLDRKGLLEMALRPKKKFLR